MPRRRSGTAYLFLAPFLILFAGFFIGPILYAGGMSLFAARGQASRFVGLTNYTLAVQDTEFWAAIVRVTYFGVLEVAVLLTLALVVALVLDSPLAHAPGLYRLLYFLPYAVPGVVGAIVWAYLFSPTTGPLQSIVSGVGLRVDLLSSDVVLYSIMVIATWAWAGYTMTLLSAGLTAIAPELYDAARLDGAGEVAIAVRIKVPLLRPLLVLSAVVSLIGSLQLFNEPYILSTVTSIPSTFTPNLDIYNTAFQFGAFNYAATLAILLTALTAVAAGVFLLVTGRAQGDAPWP